MYIRVIVTLSCSRCGTGVRGADYYLTISDDVIGANPHLFVGAEATANVSTRVLESEIIAPRLREQRLIRVDAVVTVTIEPGKAPLILKASEEQCEWEFQDIVWHDNPW